MAYKRVLSIELGAQTTRICEMDFRNKKPSIYNCCTFDTPEGSVEDGFIRNREILSVAMKEAMAKSGMKTTSAVFAVSSSKIANREVNMPIIPESKIKNYITTNAKEYFPVDIDEYVITHKVLEKITEAEEKVLRVLVLAAPQTLIESYYDFARMVGFDIVGLDYIGNSCYEVVKRQTGEGVNLVIQLNEQNTLINILDDEILALQRTVPYGMNAMIEAALNCGEFDIADRESAIEKLYSETLINSKLNESVIDDVALAYMENNDDSYANQLKQMKAKDEITETFNYLISNVIRVLDYYAAKNPDKKVVAIHLSGVGSRIKGISHLFKNEIFIDINKFENILGVNFERSCMIQDVVKSDYLVAVGAAIDPVDFIPKDHLMAQKSKSVAKGASLLFTACIIVAFLLIVFSIALNTASANKKKSLENELTTFSDIETVVNERNEALNLKTNIENAYKNSMNVNTLFNVLLEELESNLPSNVSITSINSTGNNLSLGLSSTTYGEIGQALIQLKKCALIESISISAIGGSSNDEGINDYSFAVNCTVKQVDFSKFIYEKPTEVQIRGLLNPEEAEGEDSTEGNEETTGTAEDATESTEETTESTDEATETTEETVESTNDSETTDENAGTEE